MVSSYTQPSPRTSIMSNNIITIMIFMHSAHSGEGAHYHIPAFKYRHFFGFCTLNKMHLCPLYTVFLLLQARYIISMYLLATHHPLPLGQPTQVRSHRQKLSLDYYEQFHLIPASAQPAPYTMHTNPLQTTVHTTQSAVRADQCLWYRGVKTHNTRQTRQCNV